MAEAPSGGGDRRGGGRDQRIEKDGKGDSKELTYGLYFLALVVLLYVITVALRPGAVASALEKSWRILRQVAPVLLLIWVVMAVTNLLVERGAVRRYLGEASGPRGWAIAVAAGILSHGPVYAWFPFLRDMRRQGMRSGLVVAFLYNRAIKVPLLPIMVLYFGTWFVAILLVYMVVASVAQGKLVEVIEGLMDGAPGNP